MTISNNISKNKLPYSKDQIYKFASLKIWLFLSVMVLLSTLTFLY